jgi:hypothetical protein
MSRFGDDHGKVSIMSAEDAAGFIPTGHNSANWIARIEGPTAAVTVMGLPGSCADPGRGAQAR